MKQPFLATLYDGNEYILVVFELEDSRPIELQYKPLLKPDENLISLLPLNVAGDKAYVDPGDGLESRIVGDLEWRYAG